MSAMRKTGANQLPSASRVHLGVLRHLNAALIPSAATRQAAEAAGSSGSATGVVSAAASTSVVRRHSTATSHTPPEPAIVPSEYRPFELIEREDVNHNTRRFRFKVPDGQLFHLPTGQHISLKAEIDGKPVMRSYTPTHAAVDPALGSGGYFDLVIKVYPDGRMSSYVDSLPVGGSIDVRGPKGRFKYAPGMYSELGMIAGGTGITPMLQVIDAVLNETGDDGGAEGISATAAAAPSSAVKLSLIFANVAEEDILLKERLDALAAAHANLRVLYVLERPSDPDAWEGGVGYVGADHIEDMCPPPGTPGAKVLLCGPTPMTRALKALCTDRLGYDKDELFTF